MTITSQFPDVEIPKVTLPEFVLDQAAELGDKPAVVDGASGRGLSYAELDSVVRQVAAGFAARGMRRGDVLALMMPNLPEYVAAVHGALTAGGVVTTLSPLASVSEAGFQLADTGARWLLTVPPFLPTALAAAAQASVEEVFVLGAPGLDHAGAATPWAELISHGDRPPPVSIDPATDLAALPYSSGTTGLPKGVMLTHRALIAAVVMQQAVLRIEPTDRVLCPVPFAHIVGFTVGMNSTLSAGATCVVLPRFDIEQMFAAIQRQRATVLLSAPPIVGALAKHPLVDQYDLSSLQHVVCGSAPLSAGLQAAAAERIGCFLGQGYGMTETGLIISASPGDRPARPGSAGMLVPNMQARLVDPATGADAGPGQVGELWVRGPQLMDGYLGNPEATAATMAAGGWLRTGDLVRIDDDGALFVVDRLKDLIKYKGYQVAPVELEARLGTHPAVADAAVIGRPDEDAGEIPVGYVVRRGEVSADELIAHVSAEVAPQHRVRAIEFVTEIPRSPAGKILRRALAEQDRARHTAFRSSPMSSASPAGQS